MKVARLQKLLTEIRVRGDHRLGFNLGPRGYAWSQVEMGAAPMSLRRRLLPTRSAVLFGIGFLAHEPHPLPKDVIDALSAVHPARRVVCMKEAQVGAREADNYWLGYPV